MKKTIVKLLLITAVIVLIGSIIYALKTFGVVDIPLKIKNLSNKSKYVEIVEGEGFVKTSNNVFVKDGTIIKIDSNGYEIKYSSDGLLLSDDYFIYKDGILEIYSNSNNGLKCRYNNKSKKTEFIFDDKDRYLTKIIVEEFFSIHNRIINELDKI